MKRLLLPLMLLVASLSTFAHHFEVDGVYYRILSDAKLTCEVTYEGMYSTSAVYSGDVVIPSQVTYKGKTYSVTSIGVWAFQSCSGLTSITIPNSVTDIGSSAFSDCTGLTSVTFPNSVTSIGNGAFWKCTGLTSVTIPNSVTNIGNYAFTGCFGLTNVNIYDLTAWCNIYFEGNYANPTLQAHKLILNGEEIKNLIIPEGVKSIKNYCFYGCSGLTSITIPNSVTSIGINTFSGCSGLTSITIPNSVTSIGDNAFRSCTGLTSITIPNSVTNIGNDAFKDCTSLPVIDNLRYADCYLVEAVDKTLGEYKLKESTRYIGNSAFSSCTSLRKLELPKNLVRIGQYAFYDCYSLQSVIIPKNVTSIGEYAFGHCSMLSSLTVKALTPPVCGSFALADIDKSVCQLYVPYGTRGYYWYADQWRNFNFVNELEKEPDAIKDVNADAKATTDGKFLENGRLIIRKAGKTYNAAGVEL